jgi:TPR repeat protein
MLLQIDYSFGMRKETTLKHDMSFESSEDRIFTILVGVALLMLTIAISGFSPATAICANSDGKPLEILLELAQKGDSEAQFEIGLAYYYGKGVSQNQETALGWFRKAAEQGHAAAQYAIGRMYYYGHGVGQDVNESVKWFRNAAENGYADAQFALGVMYQFGKSVEKDFKEAKKWYQSAAEKGMAAAQFALGTMYHLGQGVVKDAKEGVRWLQKAAEQNYEPASQTLVIIESGGPDVEGKIQRMQLVLSEAL